MNEIRIQYCKTIIGELILGAFENQLCLLDFRYRKMRQSVDNRVKRGLQAEYVEQADDVLEVTKKQLDDYLNGVRNVFDIPLLTVGTEFQKNVWQALLNVPYGTTSTYLKIAREIGNKKAVRAVANANGANAIGIIIPCHRIIGTNGELVGYGGGIAAKKRLLKLEKAI
ncbi:MAG: methylated-DNA--[protein]-cysteine S-methyltransferase [Thermodesulfobacteriota bacterium]